MKTTARTNASGTTTSSPLTAGATSEATTAAIVQPVSFRDLCVRSVFAISRKQSAAYGYASGSATMYDEYASDGIAAAPAAANSAARLPVTMRARKYVGKTTDVITNTSTYLMPA